MRRWPVAVSKVAALLIGMLAAGCGDASSDGAPTMQMFDNRYAPRQLQVSAGSSVAFPNDGRVNHNVIDVGGTFDSRQSSGVDQKPEESWSHTFTEPGTYQIFCSLHAVQNKEGEWEGMVATLTVTP